MYAIKDKNGRFLPFPLPKQSGASKEYQPASTHAFERRSHVKKWADRLNGTVVRL